MPHVSLEPRSLLPPPGQGADVECLFEITKIPERAVEVENQAEMENFTVSLSEIDNASTAGAAENLPAVNL